MEQLVQAGKKARSSLVIGLAVLCVVWLLDPTRWLDDVLGASTSQRFEQGMNDLGPAGRLLLIGAVAGSIGAVVLNLLAEPAVRRYLQRSAEVPWDEYQTAALHEVRRYAEHFIPSSGEAASSQFGWRLRRDDNAHRVPSLAYERYLMSQYESRVELQQEVEFRAYLNGALVFVTGAVALQSGWRAALVGAPVVIVAFLDARRISHSVLRSMRDAELKRLEQALVRANERVRKAEEAIREAEGTGTQLGSDQGREEELHREMTKRNELAACQHDLERARRGRRLGTSVRRALAL